MNMTATAERALQNEITAQQAGLAGAPPPLRELRLNAMRHYAKTGLPTRKQEAWRWTDLTPLYDHLGKPSAPAPSTASPLAGPFAAIDCWRLTFINGVLQNSSADLPAGVRAISLRAALNEDASLAASLSAGEGAAFLSLNTALLNDGAFIHLAPNVRLSKPLHLVFFNTGNAHIRNLVMLAPRAAMTLLESHYGAPDADYFVNQASDVHMAEGARLSHYRDQAESHNALHFQYLNARLEAHCAYDGFTLTRGARLSRFEAHIAINGAEADCSLNGVTMLDGAQLSDTTCIMAHLAPASRSSQMFRNVLADQSQGVFQGLIRVAKVAQRTDARQQIKALLLSPKAVQNAKPELEILADDVKCAHGASAGQLDEAALFYLRARGINEAQARALLIAAFLDDAVAQIQGGNGIDAAEIRNPMQSAIGEWLTRQLAVAHV